MNRFYNKKKFENKITALAYVILLILIQSSCRKLVDIPQPINSITDEAVYSTDATATAILTGLYTTMSQPRVADFTGKDCFPIYTSLSSDELYLSGSVLRGTHFSFFQNTLIDDVGAGGNSWGPLFNYVYRCNASIEGLALSQTLSPGVKQQLLGEAHFLRAFYYFHLVNLFGPVPLATGTNYKINTLLVRAPVAEVYELIISDLKQAQELLNNQFLNGSLNAPSIERIRPTRWAATALLARAYLYIGDYSNATAQATAVIDNSSMFSLLPLNEVFLKNSQEAIWQLQPVTAFFNTEDAKWFIIPPTGFTTENIFYLNPSLVNSFEPEDQRRALGNWIGEIIIDTTPYYYAYKYKNNTNNPDINSETGTENMTEYQMMLRLAEQYLIRAEARAQENDLAGAISDLDFIRSRAGLPLIATTNPGITKNALLEAILHERRVELFTEFCHRWFDLKRTGKVDAVMSIETPLKGSVWESREALYPLPPTELHKAPNLEQNPGYPTF
ncbi:MAG: RagB/SusD family nutrient uptake outer membrane protein [Chitinophagaceae bacterium]|nr:RagB/SusD family nutrient uptake outer membrane protein [Chitinophagaceae bacterium]